MPRGKLGRGGEEGHHPVLPHQGHPFPLPAHQARHRVGGVAGAGGVHPHPYPAPVRPHRLGDELGEAQKEGEPVPEEGHPAVGVGEGHPVLHPKPDGGPALRVKVPPVQDGEGPRGQVLGKRPLPRGAHGEEPSPLRLHQVKPQGLGGEAVDLPVAHPGGQNLLHLGGEEVEVQDQAGGPRRERGGSRGGPVPPSGRARWPRGEGGPWPLGP